MDDTEYRKRVDAIKAKYEADLLALEIEDGGQCPKFKGHFDGRSFEAGVFIAGSITFIAAMAVAMFIH